MRNHPELSEQIILPSLRSSVSLMEKGVSAFFNGIASPYLTAKTIDKEADLLKRGIEARRDIELEKIRLRQENQRYMYELWGRGEISAEKFYTYLINNLDVS